MSRLGAALQRAATGVVAPREQAPAPTVAAPVVDLVAGIPIADDGAIPAADHGAALPAAGELAGRPRIFEGSEDDGGPQAADGADPFRFREFNKDYVDK